MVDRDDRHFLQDGIIERASDGVLHIKLLQLEVCAGDGEVLLAIGHFSFGLEHLHFRNGLQRKLLTADIEGLGGKLHRALIDLFLIVSAHQVPIEIADLGYRGDGLGTESDVRDLLIGFGDTQKAQVRSQSESGQQLLLHEDLDVRGELRIDALVGAVEGLTIVVEFNLETAASGKRLLVGKIALNGVVVNDRDAVDGLVGQQLGEVINKRVGRDEWIVAGDRGTRTQRRGDQTRCSGSCTACAAAGATRSSASTPAEATGAGSPRSAGDYGGSDAADGTASRGAQNIHLRDGDVVASDDEVEVVFESEVDGIAQGQIELAVLDERIESRRIGQARGRHDGAAIGIDG